MIHEQDQVLPMTFVSSGSQRTKEKADNCLFYQQLVYLLSFCFTILKLLFEQLPVVLHGGIPDVF